MSDPKDYPDLVGCLIVQLDDMKAELDRVKYKSECQAEGINAFDKKLREAEAEVTRLKDEVERLTKAGDNLVYVASEHPVSEPFVEAWFAAKWGGQP
jgi:hypothetical protein